MRKIGLCVVMAFMLCGCGAKESDNAAEYAQSSSAQVETAGKITSEQKEASTEEVTSEQEKASAEEGTSEQEEASAGEGASEQEEASAGEEISEQAEEPAEKGEIEEEAAKAADSAETLQEKMANIEKVADKYQKLLQEEDGSQMELNDRAEGVYYVWDAALNHLWKDMRGAIDKKTMANVTKEQKRWIKCKETVAEMVVSEYKEGSIYPMLYHMQLASITRNRVYQLMAFFAEEKGETFEMPEKDVLGSYIDDMETDKVYSSLVIKEGMEEGALQACLSVYRTGEAVGTVKKKGKDLIFKCSDYHMTGKITYGWKGAVFTVTKVKGETPFQKGDKFEFPKVF